MKMPDGHLDHYGWALHDELARTVQLADQESESHRTQL